MPMFQQFTAQGRVITYREHTARKTQVITYVLEHKLGFQKNLSAGIDFCCELHTMGAYDR